MVSNKKPFEYYAELVSNILNNAEEVIIFNADFEINFLSSYGIILNNKIFNLMIEFAEIYGEFN